MDRLIPTDKKLKQFVAVVTNVESRIVEIRRQSVLLDADVADLYGVETRRINEAVRNNPDKFPSDYMFALTKDEAEVLLSKISTTKLSSKSRVLPDFNSKRKRGAASSRRSTRRMLEHWTSKSRACCRRVRRDKFIVA